MPAPERSKARLAGVPGGGTMLYSGERTAERPISPGRPRTVPTAEESGQPPPVRSVSSCDSVHRGVAVGLTTVPAGRFTVTSFGDATGSMGKNPGEPRGSTTELKTRLVVAL